MKYLILYLVVLVSTVSCGKKSDYVYLDNPRAVKTFNQKFNVSFGSNQVDILWVVDNSGSMSDIQKNIMKNAQKFMEEFVLDKKINWRMGVLSTDRDDEFYLGINPTFDRSFGVNDPNQTNLWIETFTQAIGNLGTWGDASEFVFYNIRRAMLDADMGTFFRKGAHLAIIMVTDEKEQSQGFGALYQPRNFLNFLKGRISPERILRFYGAFGLGDLDGCRAFDDYKGSSYEEVINITGGFYLSACQDFGPGLANIGNNIASFVETPYIVLNQRPDTRTLKVSFRGVEIPGGPKYSGGKWYYDEYFNKIYFYDLDFIPADAEGDIDVFYEIYDEINRDDN